MPRIHACLLGEWVCLNDDPNAFIGDNKESPNLWYKQNAEIWAPNKKRARTHLLSIGLCQSLL